MTMSDEATEISRTEVTALCAQQTAASLRRIRRSLKDLEILEALLNQRGTSERIAGRGAWRLVDNLRRSRLSMAKIVKRLEEDPSLIALREGRPISPSRSSLQDAYDPTGPIPFPKERNDGNL